MAKHDAEKTPSESQRSIESAETALVLFPQRKRQELGRFLLQVDRQTKVSYHEREAAEVAGLAIKTGHPILQVVVYDAVECSSTVIDSPKIS